MLSLKRRLKESDRLLGATLPDDTDSYTRQRHWPSWTSTTLALAFLIFFLVTSAQGAELIEAELNPGDLAASIYVPDDLPKAPALVVALHGCTQKASDYDDETGWTALADEFGFILLFPEQKPGNNIARCFNWMLPDDRTRGTGEPESIKQMIDAVIHRYRVDPGEVFITGLSAGAAMTSVMLATYPETFAGGAIIAGIPYQCVTYQTKAFSAQAAPICMSLGNLLVKSASEWGRRVRSATDYSGLWPLVSIWHGSSDLIVNPVNAVDLMEQWTDVHGIDQQPEVDEKVNGHPHKVYKDSEGHALVETYEIIDMGHAVPVDPDQGCGIDRIQASDLAPVNDYMSDAGICSSRRIIEFWGLEKAR